jgi:hypothetical protein
MIAVAISKEMRQSGQKCRAMKVPSGTLDRHARDFENRGGFTYSILDDDVIGCLHIYPSTTPGRDASVSSWVRASWAEMDVVVYRSLSTWIGEAWPFESPEYAARPDAK